jgi:hypothetical protein
MKENIKDINGPMRVGETEFMSIDTMDSMDTIKKIRVPQVLEKKKDGKDL